MCHRRMEYDKRHICAWLSYKKWYNPNILHSLTNRNIRAKHISVFYLQHSPVRISFHSSVVLYSLIYGTQNTAFHSDDIRGRLSEYVNPYIPTQTPEEDQIDHMQSPG